MTAMTDVIIYVIFVSAILSLGNCECSRKPWWTSFNRAGLSSCDNQRLIRGFYRSDRQENDHISLLEEADCCDMTSPWSLTSTQIMSTDWAVPLDNNFKWVYCPAGYYLAGLYRSGNDNGWLNNIEEGRCMKPGDHPTYYGHCYDQDIALCFDNMNLCRCNDGYFVTGLQRGGCNSLHCLEQLRCCKMASSPEPLDGLVKVKTRIMDTTMSKIALLAHYLGYGWCGGCRSPNVGEDFRRNGDSWTADKSGRCEGYKSDQRLSMSYAHWKLAIKEIEFGDPVIEDLQPETAAYGTFDNNEPNEATKTISISETIVRTVSHTKTSNWKYSHELGIEVSYMIGSASYRFSYENSVTTEDSTSKEQSKTFAVSFSKTLPSNSSATWRLLIFKSRTTIPYTATIIVKFSTELQGFLRWGGGYNGDSTNYHYHHRGSGDRPTFNYRFGDDNSPFYSALKQESDTNSHPWQWNDMKNMYSSAHDLINELCDENSYTFPLNGQLQVIDGKNVDLGWSPTKKVTKRSADRVNREVEDNGEVKYFKHVAKAGPNDVPAPMPPPPNLNIEVKRRPTSFPVAKQGS